MKCLLVCPRVPDHSYANYREVCELLGARYPATPLGLMTVAALLPQDWEFRLLDLNVEDMDVSLFAWADLVMATGMTPQQPGILEVIELAHRHGKRVVVGGPAATSQPDVFADADYLVLDEGEATVPAFLADYRRGVCSGTYRAAERPDLTLSPTPRFDLVNYSRYEHAGVQFSRGCPQSCEFCEIIEMHGRKPRVKTPAQMLTELDALARAGHRGHVEIVDDNFIGHRVAVKEFLNRLAAWSRARRYPFYFGITATITLANDPEMLHLLRRTDFRFVSCGIETPDRRLLVQIQKKVNTRSPIVESIHRLNENGLIVAANFIVGFDNEGPGVEAGIIECVESSGVAMVLLSLLTALPDTQLGRRLAAEGRFRPDADMPHGEAIIDQTTHGLNFRTLRPEAEILASYVAVLKRIYHPRSYFDRVLATALRLRRRARHRPTLRERLRLLRAFGRVAWRLGFAGDTAQYFWRNVARLLTRPQALETAFVLMALYLHLGKRAAFLIPMVEERIRRLTADSRTEAAVP